MEGDYTSEASSLIQGSKTSPSRKKSATLPTIKERTGVLKSPELEKCKSKTAEDIRNLSAETNRRPITSKNKQDEDEDGEQKKGSKSKLEDAINLSHLEKLKQKFKEHDQDDSNGLDIDEFEQAFRAILTRNGDISKEEMKIMFMKIDTNCDGTVDWDEFCTYMLLEYKERQDMNYVNETPFPQPFRHVNNDHRETIVGIGYLQKSINKNVKSNRFTTVDNNGTFSLWNTDMQLQKSFVLDGVRSGRGKKGKLILAMETMSYCSNSSKIVVSTSNRDLCFYDISANCDNCDLCFIVSGFENTITALHYWYDSKDLNKATLVFGDSQGQVGRIIFSTVTTGLFGAAPIKKTNEVRKIAMDEILCGMIDGVEMIIQKIHMDWSKKVCFVPHNDSFISCSMDPECSLYVGKINDKGKKKGGSSFAVKKGVNAFDYSKDYIVSGGLDTAIRVWHYIMLTKPTAMMKGHSAVVEHVIVSEHTNSIISVSKDLVIKIWDLKDHVCLQSLTKLTFGSHPVSAIYFNPRLNMLVIGSKNFNLGVLERSRKSTVENTAIKSHQKTVRAAIYNKEFNQVVSTSYDSMVCVWDLDTGEKVIQFSNCHGNHEITAMTFDPNLRRLLTAAKDGTIKIWNFNNGALLGELQNVHDYEVTDILCCKNNFITGGWSRKIVMYSDNRGMEEEEPPRILNDTHHVEDILSMALYRQDLIAYSMYNGSIIVRNAGGELVLCRFSAAKVNQRGLGYATVYYSPIAATIANHPGDSEERYNSNEHLPPIQLKAGIKKRRRSSFVQGGGSARLPSICQSSLVTQLPTIGENNDEKQYDCSVDKLIFLDARKPGFDTATLISGGNYGCIRAWSCQGGGMLGQFTVMHNATINDSVYALATDTNNTVLITGDTMGFVNVFDMTSYCVKSKGAINYPPNLIHRQKVYGFNSPPVKQKFRCHLTTITNVDLVDSKELIITSSTDCSIRLWTLSGYYVGTFGQKDMWSLNLKGIKSLEDQPFILPSDVEQTMTEDEIAISKRKKKKFNPWKSVKNVMTFTSMTGHPSDDVQTMLDEKLARDEYFMQPEDCTKSNILGKAYHRKTRPRKPMTTILKAHQEFGVASIRAYSTLDREEMEIDPKIPDPPTYMKLHGREALPRFTAQSLDLIASQQQKELNMSKDDEDEDIEYLTPEENVAKSEKFHDRNLFPSGFFTTRKVEKIQPATMCVRNIINVRKAAKKFNKSL